LLTVAEGDYSAIDRMKVNDLYRKLMQVKVSIKPLPEHPSVRINHAETRSERTLRSEVQATKHRSKRKL
jgi:hypothetical protein